MYFKQFKEELQNRLLAEAESKLDGTIEFAEMMKNGRIQNGIIYRPAGSRIGITTYVEKCYEAYQEGYPMEKIVEDYVPAMINHSQDVEVDYDRLVNALVPENIVPALIPRKGNEEMLETVPHVPFQNLEVIFKFNIPEFFGGGMANVSGQFSEQFGFDAEELLDIARENDQNLFYVGVNMVISADTKEELDSITETLRNMGNGRMCQIEPHYYQQMEALNTVLPVGNRQVSTLRTMLTRDIAALLPFNVQELNENGICYGINQVSHNLCIADRKNLANGNGMVFGIPGSGKSYFSKSEMLQVFLGTEDDIIVIDPTLEYFDIAEALGSQAAIINLSTYTKNHINPLELDVWSLDLNDSQGYVRDKGEFMLGLCEQCYGDNLNSRHKSIIDRCVRKMYIDIAKSREKYIPTMSDFYELLTEQPEPEAQDIALALELFVNGSLNIFNNHTNVNVQARFVVYGTRDLGKELGAISTLVMLENISARIAENAKIGRATWLYIDEFHTVLDKEYSAKYLYTLWKKVRKLGGLCTGITQNIVDMLQNYTAVTMLGNSEFIALLKQANVDSQELSRVAGIPEAQLRFVNNSPSGTGIIKHGSICIPFDNRMSKEENPIYALFNTNLHEKAKKGASLVGEYME